MSDSVEPLPEPIESTAKHDPYVNARFLAIFEHPENADVARAFTVGLAINDPERPSTSETPASAARPRAFEDGPIPVSMSDTATRDDSILFTDLDGDRLFGLYHVSECEEHGAEPAVYLSTDDGSVVCFPTEALPEFIAWLQSRVAKGERERGES